MTFYHGTSKENWEKIQKEGILFGVRESIIFPDGTKTNPSRCTYLAVSKEEAIMYGEVLLQVEYDPFKNLLENNYQNGCWQLRVYEPISLDYIKKIN